MNTMTDCFPLCYSPIRSSFHQNEFQIDHYHSPQTMDCQLLENHHPEDNAFLLFLGGVMLEIASLFRTYYHFRMYTSQSGLPHLYKSVLALLYCTFYLVTPLIISFVFPSFSSSISSLSLLLTHRKKGIVKTIVCEATTLRRHIEAEHCVRQILSLDYPLFFVLISIEF